MIVEKQLRIKKGNGHWKNKKQYSSIICITEKEETALEQIIKERKDERPDEFRPPSFY